MERIGLAASKIARGNLFLYNFFVILISFLFSLMIFFIAGSSVFLALIIIAYVVSGVMPTEIQNNWAGVMRICMVTLTILVGCFNLFAILKNAKLKK